MQAIETKYLGPTDHRGSRVKATAEAGSLTISWDDALDVRENHARAALEAIRRWGWSGRWVGGSLAGRGYAFVCVPGSRKPGDPTAEVP
jgi:hypothetical protein